MKKFELTACSTADMPREFFESNNIPFACFHFLMDGVEYPDDLGKTMPIDEFYDRVAAGAQPTTSQVNEQDYMDMWRPLLERGMDVLHITLSSGISGTINSARVAREEIQAEFPERKLIVIDSLGASSGYGLLVTKAMELRDAGEDVESAAKYIEDNKLRVHHWFFSTDLSSFYRGGRISRSSAWFGTVLKICPLLNMNELGELIPREKIRTKNKVIEAIVDKMAEHAEGGTDYSGKCYISNSACLEDARAVVRLVEARFRKLDGHVMINNIGTVIGSHTGPGTVALFFWGDSRADNR
ncbi:MAG: DegV family protein [Oscillospiraceae bacterium]|jgi:DegV family protein with EDD domain|nr:DegV family protein [Oscillospiraceae bacterium]